MPLLRKQKNRFKYFAVLILVLLFGLGIAALNKPDPDNTLTVMTYNMGDDTLPTPTFEETVRIIRENGVPDVLFVQDVPWEIEINRLAASLKYPYFVCGRQELSVHHIGILSKFPLTPAERLRFPIREQNWNSVAAMAISTEMRMGSQKACLCSVHLPTLKHIMRKKRDKGESALKVISEIAYDQLFRKNQHSACTRTLVDWIKRKKIETVIIGGDFNTFPGSKAIRIMNGEYEDALWPSIDYFRGTKMKVNEVLSSPRSPANLGLKIRPRIDYIFHSENIDCLDAEIIKKTAGDHYPVRAVLSLP